MLGQQQIAREIIADRLACEHLAEQAALHVPAGPVIGEAQIAAFGSHRSCRSATLRSASSARYDDRTIGALAQ